jgi:hydroxymethylpyrimidine/phosphomethylpyrimidine kinase
MSRRQLPFVVAIGGFDPSCGAGVVADARSIEASGGMPLAVVTALTVQSGTGVRLSSPVSAQLVLRQLDELLERLPVRAIKIGQVPTPAIARALARRLSGTGLPLVLDPVLQATGGGELAGKEAAAAIKRYLLPPATLLTVNLREASVLTGRRVTGIASMQRAARELCDLGAKAVLVKGGHLSGDPVDVLCAGGSEIELRSGRIAASMHGTGCALAAAAATRLAIGDNLQVAVRRAREHVRRLLKAAQKAGGSRLRAPESY